MSISYKEKLMPRSNHDQGKVQRQNQIKRLLSLTSEESALSITEITQKLTDEGYNINRKTVERDIEDISRDHPLSETASNPRRFFFDGEFKLNFELVFDENELQTIVLAIETLKQMSPKVLKGLCNNVETTLVSKLPRALGKEFEHLKTISNVSPTVLGEGGDVDANVFNTVLICLRKGKVFECQYSSPYEERFSERKRSFAPLKLHFVGAPYLYVYDCETGEIKLLRISRIKKIIKTEVSVDKKRAKELKLDHVFGAFGRGDEKIVNYIIQCKKSMAMKLREQKIHPSQKIEPLKDDLFEVRFTVHESNEVVRLLSQFGGDIKDIKPAIYFEKVKQIWREGLGLV
jgi:predicted DNA-binding transcriptional regulator YafY